MPAIKILLVLCFGFLTTSNATNKETPSRLSISLHLGLSKPRLDDSVNYRSIVYVEELKYTRDLKSNKFAKVTLRNTSKYVLSGISFNLNGNWQKGCNHCYEIRKKIKLKPNQSVSIYQRLNTDDCELHTVENLKVQYTLNVNFTLD